MFPESLVKQCTPGGPSVTEEFAKKPDAEIRDIAEKLFSSKKDNVVTKLVDKLKIKKEKEKHTFTKEDLDQIAQCGSFPYRPSDLFLQIYGEALMTLEHDPLAGLCSPSLLASSGVVNLSIISVIPDIIDHYADCIVRAEKEIFFATNFWESSDSATRITDAFKELSRRAGEKGQKVVVKLMYDRGNPKQVAENHQYVDEKEWTGERVKIPKREEIPNLDFELINFHRPPVGTFHAKYMVIDRKITLLNSNNIQDRVNVEMMAHIEGPIVQSFYDMALLSWARAMHPPLPLLASPPAPPTGYAFGSDHDLINQKDLIGGAEDSRKLLSEHHDYAVGAGSHPAESQAPAQNGDSVAQSQQSAKAQQNRQYDMDDYSEAERIQKTLGSEAEVSTHLNTGTKIDATATLGEGDLPFKPFILHSKHDPFPMALVNRRPHGRPGHSDTKNPQDAAWLAAFKYAKRKVFIQTPTFNAPPVVDAALDAARRGIEVIIFMDLGFNDEGELLPFQGGTNEMVATRMYKELETDEQKKNLRLFWYTGKDQKTPLNAKDKSRNCHVKLMIVDDAVGIQGNGNQDAQSWFHSQEINVLIDSETVCKEWTAGIRSNQNTHIHGELDKDGIWRDDQGQPLPGATGGPKGPFKSLTGVKGAIQRVRGEGGF